MPDRNPKPPKLFKRCKCAKAAWPTCEHDYWTRFKVRGARPDFNCGTPAGDAALVEAIRLRAQERETAGSGRRERVRLSQLAAAHIAAKQVDANSGHITQARVVAVTDHWTPPLRWFGTDFDPAKLSFALLERYRDHRRLTVVDQTIEREFLNLKQSFELGALRGWKVAAIPTWPKLRHAPKNEARAGKTHAMEYVLAVRAECDAELIDRLDFDVTSGLRKHELMRLHASWVIETPAAIGVPAVIRLPADGTKDGEERFVPVTDRNLAIIRRRLEANRTRDERAARWERRHKRTRKRWRDPGLVFGGDRKKSLYKAIAAAQARLVEKYGFAHCEARGYLKSVTLRDLRATFSTQAEKATGDKKAVADLLGHDKLTTTDIYLHSDVPRMVAAARGADEWFTRALESGGTHEGVHEMSGTLEGIEFRQLFRGAGSIGAGRIELPTPTVSSQGQARKSPDLHAAPCHNGNEESQGCTTEGVHGGGTRRRAGGES